MRIHGGAIVGSSPPPYPHMHLWPEESKLDLALPGQSTWPGSAGSSLDRCMCFALQNLWLFCKLEIFKNVRLAAKPSRIKPRHSKTFLNILYASQKLVNKSLIAFEDCRSFMKHVTVRVHVLDFISRGIFLKRIAAHNNRISR